MTGHYSNALVNGDSAESSQSAATLKEPFSQVIVDIAAIILAVDSARLDTERDLSEYGMGSLQVTQLAETIRKTCDIQLSPAQLYGHKNIGTFVDFLLDEFIDEINTFFRHRKSELEKAEPEVVARNKTTTVERFDKKTPFSRTAMLSNAHLSPPEGGYLIRLSAKNESLLAQMVSRLMAFSTQDANPGFLADLEYGLSHYMPESAARLSFSVNNRDELALKLQAYIDNQHEENGLFLAVANSDLAAIRAFNASDARLIAQWFKQGQLHKLSALWVKGVDIDWARLYQGYEDQFSFEQRRELKIMPFASIGDSSLAVDLQDINLSLEASEKASQLKASFSELEQFGALCALSYFQRHCVFTSNESLSLDAIREQLAIDFKALPAFISWLEVLLQHGYVAYADGSYKATPKALANQLSDKQLLATKNDILQKHTSLADPVHLLWSCFESIDDVMKGVKTGSHLFASADNASFLNNIFVANDINTVLNTAVANVVDAYVRELVAIEPDGFAPKVLELVAANNLAKPNQALLSGLSNAQGKNTHYAVATITNEDDPSIFKGQASCIIQLTGDAVNANINGLEEGGFDIAVITNSLHSCNDIGAALASVKQLLKKNGLLVVCETTHLQAFSTLVFSFTDGWLSHRDPQQRIHHSPFLTVAQWQDSLNRSGFLNPHVLSDPDDTFPANIQRIIVAQSDGMSA